jgi:predicted small metal-binding protein
MEYMIEDGFEINSDEIIEVIRDIKPDDLFYGKENKVLEHIGVLQFHLKDEKLCDTENHVLVSHAIDLIDDDCVDSLESLLRMMQDEYLRLLIVLVIDKIDSIKFAVDQASETLVNQHLPSNRG